jgi:ABC-type phosphate transport system substrate-binding protein
LATVAFASLGAAQPAHAQIAFGAGATFPAVVYRGLFDCLYSQAQGSSGKPGPQAIMNGCPGFNSSGFGGLVLYAPVGSGSGKTALRTNAPAGTPSGNVPYTDAGWGVTEYSHYVNVQFAGSDDVINAADMAAWNTGGANSPQTKFGNLIQIPSLSGPVGIGFGGTDGTGAPLTIVNSTPAGGSSGLNLSRNAVCGIFSGHITRWDNKVLKALNGNTVLGTGNITVVHRSDGSGTTFLLSNALAAQCQFEFGENSETDPTIVSWAFPWTDRAASACPYPVANGANLLNWPDLLTTQCGSAISNPGGGHFEAAAGSGGVETQVRTQPGRIGYASPDYWLPVKTGGVPAANLQSQWDIAKSTGQFHPPTAAGAKQAMASVTPVFNAEVDITDPLSWSLQGVVPNPVLPGAYPISGFTWLLMYQCYQTKPVNSLTWFREFMNYLYGSNDAKTILANNGFSEVPYNWLVPVSQLLTDPAKGPNFVNDSPVGCAGHVGAL